MTDDERDMLHKTHKMTVEMHNALMQPSATGEAPFIKRAGAAVVAMERANWGVKILVYMGAATGTLLGAYAAMKGIVGK